MLETPILIVDHRAGDRCSRVVALSLMGAGAAATHNP